MSRSLWLLPVALIAGIAEAQLVGPAAPLAPPSRGELMVTTAVSLFEPEAFRLERIEQEFPGKLSLIAGGVAAEYGLTNHIGLGVSALYRRTSFRSEFSDDATTAQGMAGFGGFIDIAHRPRGLRSIVRLGFIETLEETDPVLTPSDGLDRYFAALALAGPSDSPIPWRAQLDLVGGAEVDERFGEMRFRTEIGLRWRVRRARVALLAAAAVRYANAGRQEGTLFKKENANNTTAGGVVELELSPLRLLRLAIDREFAAKNALTGTRATLSAVFR